MMTREMTVAAIRKRFDENLDLGSLDHEDLLYLYKRAEAANDLGAAIRRFEDAHGGQRPNLATEKDLHRATVALLAATA